MQRQSFKIIIIVTLLILPDFVLATPAINSLSGTVSDGENVVISGEDFLDKTSPRPFKYDDFETGNVGDTVNGWTTGTIYSKEKVRITGRQSSRQSYITSYADPLELNTANSNLPTNLKQIYVSGWFNFESTGFSRNTKIINMGTAEDYNGWQTRIDVYPINGSGHLYAHNSGLCSGGSAYVHDYNADVEAVLKPDGEWHRIETYLRIGHSGYRDVWIDGEKIGEISGDFTGDECSIAYLLIGHFFAQDDYISTTATPGTRCDNNFKIGAWVKGDENGTNPGEYMQCLENGYFSEATLVEPPVPTGLRYWDELYVDNTRARVEIGDASTWAANIHREIQIPSAWSDNSITFTANKGSFNNGGTAYLYVVDENGEVNASGYPIIFGQGVDDVIAPNAPSGLSVQ